MSNSRQEGSVSRKSSVRSNGRGGGNALVRGNSGTHPPGRVTLPTQPGWDYLVFAHSGVVNAVTETRAWTIPAHRALCVPDGTLVRIESAKRAAIRCLYFDRTLDVLGPEARVVTLTPLTRELLMHALDIVPISLDTEEKRALITLLAEQLSNAPDAPLHLALPIDPVAKELALSIMSDPAVGLEEQLRGAGASRRTIERRFKSDTHMSLGQWRRRARILAAVSRLALGHSVTEVAVSAGYASPSAFVAAFRSELGSPPRAFMQK